MSKVQRFEDLEVWQRAIEIGVEIYNLCQVEKIARDYGLKDQLRRAAISISNNISEGFEYDNKNDFVKFLRYAKGSTGEVRNMINFLLKVGIIDEDYHTQITDKLITLSRKLYSFIDYLKNHK